MIEDNVTSKLSPNLLRFQEQHRSALLSLSVVCNCPLAYCVAVGANAKRIDPTAFLLLGTQTEPLDKFRCYDL